jgi:hypothetical protein
MMLTVVRAQLRDIYVRLVSSGLSVKQFPPKEQGGAGGIIRIGDLATTAIALKDIAYDVVYQELESNDAYHVKLPDGGLLIFQYVFANDESLLKHRLAFFPSPLLPTVDEAPDLYEKDELYGDIIAARLVRFPIRFDFDPSAHRDVLHPQSHMTLGQFENCRIPVSNPVTPNAFVMFLLRNFYFRSYVRNKNRFDKKMRIGKLTSCISAAEGRISHLVMGWT